MPVDNYFKGILKNRKGDRINVKLSILEFKDSGSYVVYAPALKVYGYGKTITESKNSFATCLEEFFRYTLNKGTLIKELKMLGWEVKKKNKVYITPRIEDMLKNNDTLAEIMDNKNYKTTQKEVQMPV